MKEKRVGKECWKEKGGRVERRRKERVVRERRKGEGRVDIDEG